MNGKRFERGQALVLIVLAIVAIFGFAALAVDFGRLYAERRRVQSAADAAALAGGYAAGQTGGDQTAKFNAAETAAFQQLRLNDVFDTDPDRNTDVRVDVEFYNPPTSGPYVGLNNYYQVIIHSAVDQVFSQFVYQGPLQLTVEAVSHVEDANGVLAGDVLHANGQDACPGLRFAGTGDTILRGGDAFSDSQMDPDGSCSPSGTSTGHGSCASGVLEGSGVVDLVDGTIDLAGDWNNNGNPTLDTHGRDINQCQQPKQIPSLPPVDCSGLDNLAYTGQDVISPGVYADGIIVHGRNTNLQLDPGIYCLDGDFLANGGTVSGEGVMIYMRHGSVQLGGGTIVNLRAAGGYSLKDPSGNEWSGMLFYMPYENDGVVHIGGGSSSTYTGTIFAPGPRSPSSQDKCIIEGSGTSLGLASNVICYSIKITGTAQVNITYREDATFHMPPIIDLAQ